MARVIDLTFPLKPGISQIGGYPDVEYRVIRTHAEHGFAGAMLNFSIHMGTHIDPPYHLWEDGETIDQIPIESLMAKGFLFDVREWVRPAAPITLEMLFAVANPPKSLAGRIVVINSGWADEAYYREDYYSRGPYLGPDTADWLVEQRVRAVGLGNPPDRVGERPPQRQIHKTLLRNGVLLIENLANLNQLSGAEFDVYAFPLKIDRGCGGPARVAAVEK